MKISSVKIDPTDTVLIVDDDPLVRDTLEQMLKVNGQRCEAVGSADEALAIISEVCFDLVLTDMQMPGRSGLDLIEEIRHIDDSIPVILITGYPSVDTAVDAMKRGAVDFIPKPFELSNITHMINKALGERRLRQENRRLQADVNKAAVIEKLNRELNSKLDELTKLYTISEAMTRFMDTEEVFSQIVQVASEVTGAERVSLMLYDRSRRHLRVRASTSLSAEVVKQTKVKRGEGIAGMVAHLGKPMRVGGYVGKEAATTNAPTGFYASRSWLSLPLYVGDQVFGVLNLTDKLDRSDFTQQDEDIAHILIEKAGVKLENQALYEGIYANLLDTLNSLVTTIEAKDPYTHQHSQRVTDYSLVVAEILGASEEELEMIDFAGLLHDIGKIGIRDEILMKTGKLTAEEYDAIKLHPAIGEKIVTPLGLTRIELAIVRNHHERIDGKGYPDGLTNEEIPFLVRIVAVADAFDAMTSTRSYREAFSVEEAIGELKRHRGTQFDPQVVDAALGALDTGRIVVRPPTDGETAAAAI